jgi:preprotein translocase subunit SecB
MAEDPDRGQPASDAPNGSAGAADAEQPAEQPTEPRLLLNSHYIKDLSFENPRAPLIFSEMQKGPTIDVNIDVDLYHLQDQLHEVVLKLRVKATIEETVAFMVELDMGGLATIGKHVSPEDRERMLITEVPRYLFPFARAVVSDMTRDGGFPPLMIAPIDFAELYRNRQTQSAAGANGAEAEAEA